jgi:hypothetical protein
MKMLIATILMLAIVLPTGAQAANSQSDAQAALDQIAVDLKAALVELTAIDESDKKLAISNQVQIDTTEMLNRSERRIKMEEIPALQERGKAADEMRQQVIDMGCPPEGGEGPIELVNRCNPLAEKHRGIVENILEDMKVIKESLATIESTRQAVSETTLANAQQQKANNYRRDQLQATKLQLYNKMISQSLAIAKNKSIASQACKALSDVEEAHCCLSVVWDGANPDRCGVELIYQVFQRNGIFGTREVKPVR